MVDRSADNLSNTFFSTFMQNLPSSITFRWVLAIFMKNAVKMSWNCQNLHILKFHMWLIWPIHRPKNCIQIFWTQNIAFRKFFEKKLFFRWNTLILVKIHENRPKIANSQLQSTNSYPNLSKFSKYIQKKVNGRTSTTTRTRTRTTK